MTASLQLDLEFDKFKQHPKRNMFESLSRINGSFFSAYDRDILKEEVNTYLNSNAA